MPATKTKRISAAHAASGTRATAAADPSEPIPSERLNKALIRWERKVRPLMEAARASERLSEDDFVVRINTRS